MPTATARLWTFTRRLVGPVAARLGVQLFDVVYGERAIDDVPPEVEPTIPLHTRALTTGDVARLVPRLDPVLAARVLRVHARGDTCVVAETEAPDATIVGFLWASLERVELADVAVCSLPPGGAYVHTAYVFPEVRGHKVLQVVARALHVELRAGGCRFTCRLIDRANEASLAGTERGGVHYRWAPIARVRGRAPFFLLPRPPALRGSPGMPSVVHRGDARE